MQESTSSTFLSKLVGVNILTKDGSYKSKNKDWETKLASINIDFIDSATFNFEKYLPDYLYYPSYYYLWVYVTKQSYYDSFVRGQGLFRSEILESFSPGDPEMSALKTTTELISYLKTADATSAKVALTALKYICRIYPYFLSMVKLRLIKADYEKLLL